MRKKLLSCVIIAVMVLSAFSLSVFAAGYTHITEINISDLGYPVYGKTLDTSYKIPTGSLPYMKNPDITEIKWYKMGPNDSSYTLVEAEETAKDGYIYKAELHFLRVSSQYIFDENDEITINASSTMANKIIRTDYKVEEAAKLTVNVVFKTSRVYTFTEPVDIMVNKDEPLWPVAGENPWESSAFINALEDVNEHHKQYKIEAQWYEESNNYFTASALTSDYQFQAGKNYNLRLLLTADKTGVFDPTTFGGNKDILVMINQTYYGEIASASAEQVIADFPFTVYGGVNSASIEGIKPPVVGEAPQKDGFTLSATGATLEFAGWEYNNGSDELLHEFTGETFENDVYYRLNLKLIPRNGFVLNLNKEDVEVNCGEISQFTRKQEEGYIIVSIDFMTQKEVVDTIAAYITLPQDSQFPNYNATLPANVGYIVSSKTENYTVNGVLWFNVSNEEPMEPNVTPFEKGKEYTVSIQIIPTNVAFPEQAESIIATINGERAECVYDENGILTISYTFVATDAIETALGDVNNDQKINAKDALVVLKIAVNKYAPNNNEKILADVNKDQKINAKDALEILKYAVNKPSCLG